MARSTSYHKVDIYLYEHMLAEAMAVVDGSFHSSDLERVIQATCAEFPDWGIRKCKQRAEGIMNAGKAKDYDTAVAWVRTRGTSTSNITAELSGRRTWPACWTSTRVNTSWCRCCAG